MHAFSIEVKYIWKENTFVFRIEYDWYLNKCFRKCYRHIKKTLCGLFTTLSKYACFFKREAYVAKVVEYKIQEFKRIH